MEIDDLDHSKASEIDSSNLSPPLSRRSIHRTLGGGSVADLLLWKRKYISAILLVSSSIVWILFDRIGYNLLSLVANVLLVLVVVLFFWAKSASLLNRPLPPLPDLEVSEDFVVKVANAIQVIVNRLFEVAHSIAIGGNVKLFLKVFIGLLIVSYIGSIFSFLTLVYIGVIVSFTIPALYDKYQDYVDDKLTVTHKVLSTQYKKIEEQIQSKVPNLLSKEKKT